MEFLFSKGLENAPLARDIRRKVFVLEQGFSEDLEFDSIDSKAWHVVMTSDGKPVGTGRLFIRSPRRAFPWRWDATPTDAPPAPRWRNGRIF